MLDRRLSHFDIFLSDGTYKVDLVIKALETEPNGPGKLLGYRAMHKKIRQEHGLNVTKDQVYDAMHELDSDGFEARDVLLERNSHFFPSNRKSRTVCIKVFFFRNVPWSVSSYFLFVNSM